jgi:uncharacterized protein YyaL (SSP411 family)
MDSKNRVASLSGALARATHPSIAHALIRDLLPLPRKIRDSRAHLAATMGWIAAAHEKCNRQGVSAGYSLRHGWFPAYPETTGYLIPTLLDYAELIGSDEFYTRALQMADWECDIQLDNGAVMGGVYVPRESGRPVVFNTGQVILGWTRAYRATGNELYLESARRAANWLCSVQSHDGAWRLKGVETDTAVHAYDVRTAWSLLEVYELTGESELLDGAKRNLDWTMNQQNEDGWFENNAFFFEKASWDVTFTHTIAYVMEGLLEAWRILGNANYLASAKRTAEKLLRIFEIRRKMSGHFDHQWKSDARYTCLTGDAQISRVWIQLFQFSGDTRFLNASLKLNDVVKSSQSLNAWHPGVRGGVMGSSPFWGSYTPFTFINWGAKFLADSLMLEEQAMQTIEAQVAGARRIGPRVELTA